MGLKQYSRLTLVLEDTSQNYGLSGNNPQVLSYDILAVQPTTEKMFQSACSTLDVDIISIDMSSKIPFYLKHTTVGQAVERGIFFEICYSAALKDASARRNLIMNAKSLIRVTRGRNLIITSQARKAMELRGPYDMVNFATLLGIGQSAAKDCLSTNCRAVLFHAETRRNTTKAVFSAEPSENLQDTEQWKLGNKRKKINLKKARATDKRPRVETDTAAEAETGS
ncbi:Ribonuclease P protein subunit p30 [Lunasporangiospora selenospora]|uniref:Ribonuclease P protein subunit p30 n=1 Tax=Lunasporangiospora selenospora TaxID=979761 RepID=A0A9P6FUV3_9FUNG|nr:Ribonuclease P protein subunit p30 [Lunasporangiospora selenospora]